MSLIARLRNLLDPARHGRELDREIAFHIAEVADDLEAHGMDRGEAERQARIRFGHRDGLREDTRAVGILSWIEPLGGDIRYALRGLRANPAFTATVVLSLALGAERSGVVQLVLGEVGRLVAIGVVAGLAGAVAAGRLVTSFLYGVTPTDPATLAATTFAVIAVGLAAGALPAWRAARLDPVAALRED